MAFEGFLGEGKLADDSGERDDYEEIGAAAVEEMLSYLTVVQLVLIKLATTACLSGAKGKRRGGGEK